MGEILGLGMTHYPPLIGHDQNMADILRAIMKDPHLKQGPDERVLHSVLRRVPVAEDSIGDREQTVVRGGREGIESLVVAPLCAFDELGRHRRPLVAVRTPAALTD